MQKRRLECPKEETKEMTGLRQIPKERATQTLACGGKGMEQHIVPFWETL